MIVLAVDAASQGLVIGLGAAILTVLGLVTTGLYKMLDGAREDIKAMRSALGELTGATNAGFARLGDEFNGLNREVGELKVRLEYVGVGPTAPPARRPGARPASD